MAKHKGRIKGTIVIDVNDIVGKRFGGLTVTAYSNCWYETTLGGIKMRHTYICRCDCGNIKYTRRSCLLEGYTKSCGCLKKGRPSR